MDTGGKEIWPVPFVYLQAEFFWEAKKVTSEDLLRWLTQSILFLIAVALGVFVAPDHPGLVVGICLGLLGILLLGQNVRGAWVLFPIAGGFSGTINLIPGGLTPLNLVCLLLAALTLYLLKSDSEFRIRLGPKWIFFPFCALIGILFFNWVREGDIGLNVLGSAMVGGKAYLTCILTFIGYVAAVSMYRPGSRHDRWIPLYILLGFLIDGSLYAITTLVPGLALYIYRVYDAVNVEAFQALETTRILAPDEGFVLRFGRTGHLAYIALAVLQTYLPYRRWFGIPQILVGPAVLLLTAFLSLVSGFRNYLVRYIIVGMIGVWQSFRIFSLFLVLPLTAVVGLLVLGQGGLFDLPAPIQRSLAFLPGDWDPAIIKTTGASSKFRSEMRRVYFKDYFNWSNFLGEGFLYNRDDLSYSQESYWRMMRVGASVEELDPDFSYRGFIIRRMHHEGVLNIHHTTGHIGFLTWLFFSIATFVVCFRYTISGFWKQRERVAHMGATLLIMNVVTYWFLYGALQESVETTLTFAFCFVAGLKMADMPAPNPPKSAPVASSAHILVTHESV
jgi:hypothetical protein